MDRPIAPLLALAALPLAGCFGAPELVGRSCSAADPCPTPLICMEGACREPCSIDDECTALGDRCVDGMCTPVIVLDEGRDGGTGGGNEPKDDPCRGVVCTDPPPSECIDNDSVFRAYSGVGSCHPISGQCEYAEILTTCNHCLATCLAPCESVRCDEENAGCRLEGFCVPGNLGEPPSCRYNNAEDGVDCKLYGAGGVELPGVCRGGQCAECNVAEDCDDQNACTDDVCDQSNGTCIHRDNNARCDDTDLCTTAPGICSQGQCVFTTRVRCESAPDDCHEPLGTCEPATGICRYPEKVEGSACNDGNACTQIDSCAAGRCSGSNPVTCNSSPGQCFSTTGTCDPVNGACSYAPLLAGSSCVADANVCTGDVCDGSGACNAATRVPPNNQSAVQSGTTVSMRWNGCTDAAHYDVNVEMQNTSGAWIFYYTYDENNPAAPTTNEKVFYPQTCNRWYRFRIRAYHGTVHDGWTGFFDFYFTC